MGLAVEKATMDMRKIALLAALCFALGISREAKAGNIPKEHSQEDYYTIQVMALPDSHKTNAEALVRKLRDKGYAAYLLSTADSAGNRLYKVRIGRYATSREARQAAEAFQRREGTQALALRSRFKAVIPAHGPPGPKPAPSAEPRKPTPAVRSPEQVTASPSPETPSGTPTVRQQPPQPPAPKRKLSWPQTLTQIFHYRDKQNNLHVTNVFDSIPTELRQRIERVSVFPVRYLGAGRHSLEMIMEIDHQVRRVLPAGIRAVKGKEADIATQIRELQGVPLRIAYAPAFAGDAQEPLYALIGLPDGRTLNIKLLRLGLADCDPQAGPVEWIGMCRSNQEGTP